MTVFVLVLITLGAALTACAATDEPAPPQISQVEWYPRDTVTPLDHLLVRANVTSDVGISMVKIFFKTSMSAASFVSISDYEAKDMWPGSGNMHNREWEFRFENQSAGTTIYFFIAAFDLNGDNCTWQNYLSPFWITVKEAGPSFIGYVILFLNDISLNNRFCSANVTAHMQGYFPGFPEFGYVDARVSSSQGQIGDLSILQRGPRFYYEGEGSVVAPLECDLENIPYDQYELELALIIPRLVDKLEFDQQIPLYSRTFPGWDIWQIVPAGQSLGRVGNETVVWVHYTLARQVPALYPPLLLLLTAFAVVGLTPLVSLYHEPHSFELFLATIALVATAALSEKLNPFAGLQTGVFEILFGIVLLSTIVLMVISLVSPIVQEVQSRRLMAEVAVTFIIAMLIIYRVLTTNLPWWAKLSSPLALVLGSFLSVLIFLRRSGDSTDSSAQASEVPAQHVPKVRLVQTETAAPKGMKLEKETKPTKKHRKRKVRQSRKRSARKKTVGRS